MISVVWGVLVADLQKGNITCYKEIVSCLILQKPIFPNHSFLMIYRVLELGFINFWGECSLVLVLLVLLVLFVL